jgi:hypothetical protein
MQTSIREYAKAVCRHGWWLGVTVLLGAVAVADIYVGDVKFPSWVPWAAAFVTLSVAQFRAFHDMRCERDTALARIAEPEDVPDFEVTAEKAWYFERDEDPGKRYLAFPIEVINRDPVRRISLRFEFAYVMRFRLDQDEEREIETKLHPEFRDWPAALPERLALEPMTDAKGTHFTHWYLSSGLRFSEPRVSGLGDVEGPERPENELVVRVTDRISENRFEVSIPGSGKPGQAAA